MKRRWRSTETYGSRMQASGYDQIQRSSWDQAHDAFLVAVTKAAIPFDDVEMKMGLVGSVAFRV